MDWQALDRMIDRFEEMISERQSILPARGSEVYFRPIGKDFVSPTEAWGFTRNDWRPVWEHARAIQAAFNSKVRYPAVSDREAAWLRFNNLRNELSRIDKSERESMFSMSGEYRDEILSEAKSAHISSFVFTKPGVDEAKALGEVLKNAGRLLSKFKLKMLREHKDQCFAAILEARQTHDRFWEEYKAELAQRNRQYAERQAAFAERRSSAIAKIETNLAANRERLAKIRAAQSRNDDRIDELREKVASARSDEWRDRFLTWLSEAEDKRASIQASESEVEGWIRQGEERLNDIFKHS